MTKLTLSPIKNSLDGIKLSESINEDVLRSLINSTLPKPIKNKFTLEFHENERKQLEALLNLSHSSKAIIKYSRPNRKYGRVNAVKGISLGMLSRKMRHTLCNGIYTDIDIANCHPVILHQVCKANNIACPHLESYITDRANKLKAVMSKYDVSRDEAKKLFIRMMYFGKFAAWVDDNKLTTSKPTTFINNFSDELSLIGDVILAANPKIRAQVIKSKGPTTSEHDIKSSVVSNYCQEIELRMLEVIFDRCVELKYVSDDAVLCFDGLMIPTEITHRKY